ncbi:MAG TPA: hypothetical protein VL984_11315 [Acidimicrobiales bacterium]|nr:hypothetical protein [Acidimicrobiales bacterium]
MAFVTVVPVTVPATAVAAGERSSLAGRLWARLVANSSTLLTLGPVMVLVGAVQAVNAGDWPAYTNDDPGTYLARAWAVQTGRGAHHSLAPYTYWYDHVPFGWIQIVPITWLGQMFRDGSSANVATREIAVAYTLISALLVFVVARRFGCSVVWSAIATGLFGLSPLAVTYLRQMYIDTIGLPWLLAAFALALSPRRRLWAFAASGAAFAGACLTKETFILWLPALAWLVWLRADPKARRMYLFAWGAVAFVLLVLYPMYAVLKGELLPGKGHVSLIGAIEWQLSQRQSTGSVLTRDSKGYELVASWLEGAEWLWLACAAAIPFTLLRRETRVLLAALGVAVLYVLHPGYLPEMFVIGVVPFAALTVACAGDVVWKLSLFGRGWGQRIWRLGCCAGLVMAGAQFVPSWANADEVAMTSNESAQLFETENWLEHHVPRSATLLVDDNVWIQLVDDGYTPDKVVWFWQLDSDPDVERRYPLRWRDINYVVITDTMRVNVLTSASSIPSVVEAIGHSQLVASFGQGPDAFQIRRVGKALAKVPPVWFPMSEVTRSPKSSSGQGAPE